MKATSSISTRKEPLVLNRCVQWYIRLVPDLDYKLPNDSNWTSNRETHKRTTIKLNEHIKITWRSSNREKDAETLPKGIREATTKSRVSTPLKHQPNKRLWRVVGEDLGSSRDSCSGHQIRHFFFSFFSLLFAISDACQDREVVLDRSRGEGTEDETHWQWKQLNTG